MFKKLKTSFFGHSQHGGDGADLDIGERDGKSRQSTRSLPDGGGKKRRRASAGGALGTTTSGGAAMMAVDSSPTSTTGSQQNSSGGDSMLADGGVYAGGKSASSAAAANVANPAYPYHVSDAVRTHFTGARSEDLNVHRQRGGSSAADRSYRAFQKDVIKSRSDYNAPRRGGDDNWSDIASDIIGPRDKSSRKHAKKQRADADAAKQYRREQQQMQQQQPRSYHKRYDSVDEDADDDDVIVPAFRATGKHPAVAYYEAHCGENAADLYPPAKHSSRRQSDKYSKSSSSRAPLAPVKNSQSFQNYDQLSQSAALPRKHLHQARKSESSYDFGDSRHHGDHRDRALMPPPPPRPPKTSGGSSHRSDGSDRMVSSGYSRATTAPMLDDVRSACSSVYADGKGGRRSDGAMSSPSPTKSPQSRSAACDQLTIQSLHTELSSERAFRSDIENRQNQLQKENEMLKTEIEKLKKSLSNGGLNCNCTRSKELERQKETLVSEQTQHMEKIWERLKRAEAYKKQYERVRDEREALKGQLETQRRRIDELKLANGMAQLDLATAKLTADASPASVTGNGGDAAAGGGNHQLMTPPSAAAPVVKHRAAATGGAQRAPTAQRGHHHQQQSSSYAQQQQQATGGGSTGSFLHRPPQNSYMSFTSSAGEALWSRPPSFSAADHPSVTAGGHNDGHFGGAFHATLPSPEEEDDPRCTPLTAAQKAAGVGDQTTHNQAGAFSSATVPPRSSWNGYSLSGLKTGSGPASKIVSKEDDEDELIDFSQKPPNGDSSGSSNGTTQYLHACLERAALATPIINPMLLSGGKGGPSGQGGRLQQLMTSGVSGEHHFNESETCSIEQIRCSKDFSLSAHRFTESSVLIAATPQSGQQNNFDTHTSTPKSETDSFQHQKSDSDLAANAERVPAESTTAHQTQTVDKATVVAAFCAMERSHFPKDLYHKLFLSKGCGPQTKTNFHDSLKLSPTSMDDGYSTLSSEKVAWSLSSPTCRKRLLDSIIGASMRVPSAGATDGGVPVQTSTSAESLEWDTNANQHQLLAAEQHLVERTTSSLLSVDECWAMECRNDDAVHAASSVTVRSAFSESCLPSPPIIHDSLECLPLVSRSLSCPRLLSLECEGGASSSAAGEAMYDDRQPSDFAADSTEDDGDDHQQPPSGSREETAVGQRGLQIDLPNGRRFNIDNVINDLHNNVMKTRQRAAEEESSGVYLRQSSSRRRCSDSSFTSSSNSSTSEESDIDDGSAFVQLWPKQLKNKKKGVKCGFGLVKYSPPRRSILRDQVYRRFGDRERKAIALFDFLKEYVTDVSCISSPVSLKSPPSTNETASTSRGITTDTAKSKNSRRRLGKQPLSSSLTNLADKACSSRVAEDDAELLRTDDRQMANERPSDSMAAGGGRTPPSDSFGDDDDDSWDSSLLLSDLCANRPTAGDDTSSSLSFQE